MENTMMNNVDRMFMIFKFKFKIKISLMHYCAYYFILLYIYMLTIILHTLDAYSEEVSIFETLSLFI